MDKLNNEKIKNIVKLSSDDFLKIQKSFFKEIEKFCQHIKNYEKSNNYLELQREIEKLKNFIQEYNIKYLRNINEEQIKYTKKLIESFEAKQFSIKSKIDLLERKKLVQKKMHEKYLERRNTIENESFEDCSFTKKSDKEISNKKVIENVIDSSNNLIKFYDKFKEISKENQMAYKFFQFPMQNETCGFHVINNYYNNSINNNSIFPKKNGSFNNNCDFSNMHRMPSMNANNMNFESYFILDNKNINSNAFNNNTGNMNSESLIGNKLQENLNIGKFIDEIKSLKNSCSGFVGFLRDDPSYIKKAENDISILKDEILKDYLKYTKLKKHIKNIVNKNKN